MAKAATSGNPHARFERLQSEYQSLEAVVDQIEQRKTEQNVDKVALRRGVAQARRRVTILKERIAELEASL